MKKRELGQYYTIQNPFTLEPFKQWFFKIKTENKTILEPFAGANNIPLLMMEVDDDLIWDCFDIEPSKKNKTSRFKIIQKDTIENFPYGYDICITNPPYLGKSSASRRKIPFPETKYDDLYKLCLDIMLKNCKYVAAIIPESFITAELFHNRLNCVISLQCEMFDDTECPVCLALFNFEERQDFDIYKMNQKVGTYLELQKFYPTSNIKNRWKFNDPKGNIGVKCVDNQKEPSIKFINGEEIPETSIKVSSRALTRISGLSKNINEAIFIKKCNEILNKYREETYDVFMTSFKGLRKDGQYRRRLDFETIRLIMNKALEELNEN